VDLRNNDPGQKLLELRIELGRSRRAMARELEIPPTTLRRYESGQATPDRELMLKADQVRRQLSRELSPKDRAHTLVNQHPGWTTRRVVRESGASRHDISDLTGDGLIFEARQPAAKPDRHLSATLNLSERFSGHTLGRQSG
jgi:transcriptional regulator with XRE-family HTH domain